MSEFEFLLLIRQLLNEWQMADNGPTPNEMMKKFYKKSVLETIHEYTTTFPTGELNAGS